MDFDLSLWLNLALRWFHVIAGIAWIGSSFYFIWLDNSLKPPTDEKDKKDGVGGELWAVHGGGFYHKKKYQVAPDHMPEDLHWFKWEAYFTWLSGFALLVLMYYFGADLYLIDQSKYALDKGQAAAIGIIFLVGGWFFYDVLCQSPIGQNNKLFGLVWFAAVTVAAYALTHIFTGRGAFIHVGAMLGTVMAANVFIIIIPNQRKVVADLLAGRSPDPALGKKAKQRSLHNNYMTLPVLFTMISNHYPLLFSHQFNWLTLAGLAGMAWMIRHYFNLSHKGKEDYKYILLAFVLFVPVAYIAAYNQMGPKAAGGGDVAITAAEIKTIVRTHCSSCHSDVPTDETLTEAPLGVRFDTMAEIRQHAARILQQAVDSTAMPPANPTGMTDEERQKLGAWLRQFSESQEKHDHSQHE